MVSQSIYPNHTDWNEGIWFFKWKSQGYSWKNGEMDDMKKVSLMKCNMLYLCYIAAIKSHHKLSGLTQHNFIIS